MQRLVGEGSTECLISTTKKNSNILKKLYNSLLPQIRKYLSSLKEETP